MTGAFPDLLGPEVPYQRIPAEPQVPGIGQESQEGQAAGLGCRLSQWA